MEHPTRWAFYGRSTEAPTADVAAIVIACQLRHMDKLAKQSGSRLVTCYWDVDSPFCHGVDVSSLLAGVRRTGGLDQLLADAANLPRRFDAIAVVSADRLIRGVADLALVGRLDTTGQSLVLGDGTFIVHDRPLPRPEIGISLN